MTQLILVPVDGSDASLRAVELASDMARALGASMKIVQVLEKVPAREQLKGYLARLEAAENADEGEIGSIKEVLAGSGEEEAEAILADARARALEIGAPDVGTLVEDGVPARVILRLIGELEADYVVMGRHGRGAIGDLLMGSVSHKVASLADCPVVTVK